MNKEFETELLRKAGYSEEVVKKYRFLKDTRWRSWDGAMLAEAYIKLVDADEVQTSHILSL